MDGKKRNGVNLKNGLNQQIQKEKNCEDI